MAGVEWRLGQLDPPHFAALLTELARDNHAFRCAPLMAAVPKTPQCKQRRPFCSACFSRRLACVVLSAPRLLLRSFGLMHSRVLMPNFLSQRSTEFVKKTGRHIAGWSLPLFTQNCMSQA